MKPLYLIDFSNWLYRYTSVYNIKRTHNGVTYDYSTLYGFIRSLKALPYDDIFICLDGVPKQSLAYLPSYKGQRLKEPNESLSFSKVELVKILTKIGNATVPARPRKSKSLEKQESYMTSLNKNIKVVCSPGQEADQVISSIVHLVNNNYLARYGKEGDMIDKTTIKFANLSREPLESDSILSRYSPCSLEELDLSDYDSTIVGTTDSDMYQLLALGSVYIDSTTSGKSLNNSETPAAVHFLSPSAIPAYKAFMGDISDNVPTLKINMQQQQFVEFVAKCFSKPGQFDKFVKTVETYRSKNIVQFIDPAWSSVFNHLVSTDQISEFLRNYKVTKLTFTSTPQALCYPDYDINTAIKRYRITL